MKADTFYNNGFSLSKTAIRNKFFLCELKVDYPYSDPGVLKLSPQDQPVWTFHEILKLRLCYFYSKDEV